ncbi:hypothetical protein KC349_g6855 [Hortaea werneckii]|nr:hypothetical protein KC349_g6855 [Hortaea werneckii]
MQEMSRPTSQHRLSVGAASSLPNRNSYSRSHSHTISLGSANNAANRVSRRKSSNFSPATNVAALGAAVENGVADGSIAVNRRSSTSKNGHASLQEGGQPASLPQGVPVPERTTGGGSALVDGPPLSSYNDKSKPKMRRASDGTRLTKKERANTGELKCEHCGKAYKHGSCLNKHLWEHTPQWQYTSKLLISKHQQVQLLEAASVLVQMNQDGPNESDDNSSPAASGSSDMHEEPSSAETTPPPHAEGSYNDRKRLSNTSSAYSRSYQSVFSESAPGNEHGFGHSRGWSQSSNRPPTADTSIADSYRDEDPADLAAAVGLLSCSYGTPKSGPSKMPSDVPPVPPLPAKYAPSYRHHEDVNMDQYDSDDEPAHPERIDEVDEGMFGQMD